MNIHHDWGIDEGKMWIIFRKLFKEIQRDFANKKEELQAS